MPISKRDAVLQSAARRKASQPKRHGKDPKLLTPQVLDVPIELAEQIATDCNTIFGMKDIYNLRLTCRSFAHVLQPFILRTKIIDVYLDEQGVDDFEALAKSEMGPLIHTIRVGIRRVGHFATVLKQLVEMPTTALRQTQFDDFVRQIAKHTPSRSFNWSRVEEQSRQIGFEMKTVEMGCRAIVAFDSTPSSKIMSRFVKILQLLPALRSLHSLEETTHCALIVRNRQGYTVCHRTLQVKDGTIPQPRRQARCVCDNDDGLCLRTISTSRFLVNELAGLPRFGIPYPESFTGLKEIHLNFVNHFHALTTFDSTDKKPLAMVISSCISLEKLQLWTREPTKSRHAGSAIMGVLTELTKLDWQPGLKTLELSSIDLTSKDLLDFLEKHKTISYFHTKHAVNDDSQYKRPLYEYLYDRKNLAIYFEGYTFLSGASSQFGPQGPITAQALPRFMEMLLKRIPCLWPK